MQSCPSVMPRPCCTELCLYKLVLVCRGVPLHKAVLVNSCECMALSMLHNCTMLCLPKSCTCTGWCLHKVMSFPFLCSAARSVLLPHKVVPAGDKQLDKRLWTATVISYCKAQGVLHKLHKLHKLCKTNAQVHEAALHKLHTYYHGAAQFTTQLHRAVSAEVYLYCDRNPGLEPRNQRGTGGEVSGQSTKCNGMH